LSSLSEMKWLLGGSGCWRDQQWMPWEIQKNYPPSPNCNGSLLMCKSLIWFWMHLVPRMQTVRYGIYH
jgi:hypothetical protein